MRKKFTDLMHFNRHVRRPLKRLGLLMAMVMLVSIGVLGALSADSDIGRKEGGLQSYPVAADTTIYKGALVVVSATGYLEEGADAASKRFAGIAYEKVINTSAEGYGSDGDLNCRVYTQGVFKLAATSITQAMVGQMMYLVDDATVDETTGGTYYIPVGRLVEYVDTDEGWVDIGQRHLVGGADNVLLAPNGTKMLEVHTWGIVQASGSLYMAADYGAYINSWSAGRLEVCGSSEVRLHVGGAGLSVTKPATGTLVSTSGRMQAGSFRLTGTGSMILGQHSDPVTPPTDEGSIWYNTTQDKLQFKTAAGFETVTSA